MDSRRIDLLMNIECIENDVRYCCRSKHFLALFKCLRMLEGMHFLTRILVALFSTVFFIVIMISGTCSVFYICVLLCL
jgi:hypothetical protein